MTFNSHWKLQKTSDTERISCSHINFVCGQEQVSFILEEIQSSEGKWLQLSGDCGVTVRSVSMFGNVFFFYEVFNYVKKKKVHLRNISYVESICEFNFNLGMRLI